MFPRSAHRWAPVGIVEASLHSAQAFRALLSAEQIDDVIVVVAEICRHHEQPFPESPARRARTVCEGVAVSGY
jgi:hypothetical protein